jgi:hypothetical protein
MASAKRRDDGKIAPTMRGWLKAKVMKAAVLLIEAPMVQDAGLKRWNR